MDTNGPMSEQNKYSTAENERNRKSWPCLSGQEELTAGCRAARNGLVQDLEMEHSNIRIVLGVERSLK